MKIYNLLITLTLAMVFNIIHAQEVSADDAKNRALVTGVTDIQQDIPFAIESDTIQLYRPIQIEYPSDYTGNIVYSSSDEMIAIVDEEGYIHGYILGEVVITVSGEAQGIYRQTTKSFNITVIDVIKDTVTFAISDTIVSVGKTLQISWTDDFDGSPFFFSSDKSVAKVSEEGVITAISEGKASITAIAESSLIFKRSIAEFAITVVDSTTITPEYPYLYEGLYYTIIESALTAEVVAPISGAESYSGDITIPSTIEYEGETYRVTSIAPCAFQDCTEVTSVTMGDNVTQIGYSAFERCKGMKSVTLGKNVVKLNYEAFKDCTSLSSVLLGSRVTTIGDRAFYRCTSLRVLNIPKGVTYLGKNFIAEAPLLGLIAEKSTPMTLTSAMLEGFDPSTCMLSVPEGSQSAYESASGWSGFQFVKENECTGQQDLIFTKYSANSIFCALYADSTLVVSGTGEMVGDDEFAIGFFPNYCRKAIIEEPILTVGELAFWRHDEYLTTAIIGDSVYNIEDDSFMGCKALTSVTIGKGILWIGDRAFRNCTSLASITVLATEPPSLDDLTFSNVDKDNCVVWVPFGCKSKYEAASGWSEFNDIRELEAELTMLGDANYDGKVRIGDATAILNYIVGTEIEGFNVKNADVNQDGKIRIGDVTSVLWIIVNQ